jgi:carboxyl-terminal processing protease
MPSSRPSSDHPELPGAPDSDGFVVDPAPVEGEPARLPAQPPGPQRRRGRSRGSRLASAVVVPALAVALFAGGVAAERAGLLPGSPAGTPAAPITPQTAEPTAAPVFDGPDTELILEAWGILREHYVDRESIDDRELAYGAIRGMTDVLGDEGHTTFLTREELAAAEDALQGRFVGIGVYLLQDDDGQFQIADVIPGSPAEERGLRPGDRITAVDGRSVEGWTQDRLAGAVRGEAGTDVTLTIDRQGLPGPFTRTITRREIDLPLASWAMVPGTTDVAVVRLESFSANAGEALREALQAARDGGARSLVFDLRGNPGGYVSEAVEVASEFLPDGIVYISEEADGSRTPTEVRPGGVATDIPLVVLVDAATASSAEIVSSAIQDAGRGTIIGEQTFGTGTVVSRFDLEDGSALRVGTVRWLSRDGRPLWHEGVTPDEVVERPDTVRIVRPDELDGMSPAALERSDDRQLLRALSLLVSTAR